MKNFDTKKSFLLFVVFFLTTLCLASQKKVFRFTSQQIPPFIFSQMIYTWHPDCPIPLDDLRYITLTHYDFEGQIRLGELVVHREVVGDLAYIFEKLFEVKFPIQSIKFVDRFDGSDLKSMQANNSSAFYARKVAGTDRWSNHAFGCAIDINPLLNPYTSSQVRALPQEGERYLDRSLDLPGMIIKNGYIYNLFKERGWQWGGECFFDRDGVIDRHHFQKVLQELNSNTN